MKIAADRLSYERRIIGQHYKPAGQMPKRLVSKHAKARQQRQQAKRKQT